MTKEELEKILEDIKYYIKHRMEENITDEQKIDLRNIELIANGTIKAVKEKKWEKYYTDTKNTI